MHAVVAETEVSVHSQSRRRKTMKRLSCRKCEGHGVHSLLKGHAPICPFNDCSCDTCDSVMQLRANALVRRFRHRKPNDSTALLKAIRSKNGNMRLRIMPKSGDESPASGEMVCSVRSVSTASSWESTPSPPPLTAKPIPTSPPPPSLSSIIAVLVAHGQLPPSFLTAFQQPPTVPSPLLTPPTLFAPLLLQY